MPRKSHMLQESRKSQKRNRKMRAKIVIRLAFGHSDGDPLNGLVASVCKAKRASQTKRRDFKRLRGEWDRIRKA